MRVLPLFLTIHIVLSTQVNEDLHPECSIYQCYASENCVFNQNSATPPIIRVRSKTPVKKDCEFLIRFFQHDSNRLTVEMESLASIANVKKIEMTQNNKKFVDCIYDGTKVEVKSHVPGNKIENEDHKSATSLKCRFDLYNDGIVITQSTPASDAITVNNKKSKGTLEVYVGCDPKAILYDRDDKRREEDRFYQPIGPTALKGYDFEIGGCAYPTVQSIEFRIEDTDYAKVNTFVCNDNALTINGVQVDSSKKLYVRCTSEAHYHCDYQPKGRVGETSLTFNKPNPSRSTAGQLACPSTHKFMKIGNRILENGVTIKCKNLNNIMRWKTSDGKILTTSGPEIYCTDSLPCKPISRSAVRNGILKRNGTHQFPTCFKEGKLTARHNGAVFSAVHNFRCDGATGTMKFTAEKSSSAINQDTIFECEYPNKAAQANEKNNKTIANTSIIALVVIVGIPCVATFLCIIRIRMKKEKEQEAFERAAAKQEEAELEIYKKITRKDKLEKKEEEKKEPTSNRPMIAPTRVSLVNLGEKEVYKMRELMSDDLDYQETVETVYKTYTLEPEVLNKLQIFGSSEDDAFARAVYTRRTEYNEQDKNGKVFKLGREEDRKKFGQKGGPSNEVNKDKAVDAKKKEDKKQL